MKCRLFDNGGKTADRYTVVYDELATNDRVQFSGRGMSDNPSHPCGVGTCCIVHMPEGFTGGGSHLGAEITLQDAPEAVQKLIASDLKEYDE